jgi:hypothetical protein
MKLLSKKRGIPAAAGGEDNLKRAPVLRNLRPRAALGHRRGRYKVSKVTRSGLVALLVGNWPRQAWYFLHLRRLFNLPVRTRGADGPGTASRVWCQVCYSADVWGHEDSEPDSSFWDSKSDSNFWDSNLKVGFIVTGGLQLSHLNAATRGPAKLKDLMSESRVGSREIRGTGAPALADEPRMNPVQCHRLSREPGCSANRLQESRIHGLARSSCQ